MLTVGEFGCVMNGQLNLVRTNVMSGSQSVTIKMLTGELIYSCVNGDVVVHVHEYVLHDAISERQHPRLQTALG